MNLWWLLVLSVVCLAFLTAGTMFMTKKTWSGPAAAFAAILWYYVLKNPGSLAGWQGWAFGLLPALLGAVIGYYVGIPVLRAAMANEENYPKEKAPKPAPRAPKAQRR